MDHKHLIFYLFLTYKLILGQNLSLPSFLDRIINPITKIVGGEITIIEDYPHHVSVRVYDIHICGGSILDEKTVITAAHCTVAFDHNLYSIRVGNSNKDSGILYQVESIHEHPNYNKVIPSDFDFSIIKLKSPLVYGKTVQPIRLVDPNIQIPSGSTVTTIGWGVTEEGAVDGPMELRQVDLQTITNQECAVTYGFLKVTDNMMCAIAPGKDSCQGDSGGSLIYKGQLCGVVSFGIGCARPGIAGIYSRISTNRNWIDSLMEKGVKLPGMKNNPLGEIVGSTNQITNLAQKVVESKIISKIDNRASVDIENAPFMASLRCYDQHYCCGEILDEHTILTTAHCVVDFPLEDLTVRVGNVNANLGKSYNISKIMVHPEFSDKTFDCNIAIIKLAGKLEFDETVKFIPIPSVDDLNPWSLITVIGWDNRENNGQDDVNLLQATELRTIDNFQCGQAYGQSRITNNMFCTIDYSKDYCHSDSGGAAVFNGFLYGIVSTGENCIRPSYPGVYTRVPKFSSWIQQNLESSEIVSQVNTKEAKLLGASRLLSNRLATTSTKLLNKTNAGFKPNKNQSITTRDVFPYLVSPQRNKETIQGSDVYSVDYSALTNKIIGGRPVEIKDFPYQASLRVLDHHICGAVIVSKTCLLTSAHCAKLYPVENYSIRVGNTKHALGTQYEVDSIYIHPLFNKTVLMDADISIIKLKTPLIYSDTVKEIGILDENQVVPNNEMLVISGWGITKDGSTTIPDDLQAAVINSIDIKYCKDIYGEEQITDNMICALQNHIQTCEGDSGAPLVWKNQLIGLASFNVGCTKEGYPGVYVKLTGKAIYDWIKTLCLNTIETEIHN